jgi:LacI family transcriptional regulator
MPPRAVTIVDIAHAAGVAPSTVSRVLHGDERITAATAERVRRAAADLGYRANLNAQELVQGRSMTIGVLIHHFVSSYFAEILNGIDVTLEGSGYHLLVSSSNAQVDREAAALDLLVRRRVDGLVLVHAGLPDADLLRAVGDVPCFCIGRVSPTDPDASLVVDNRAAAREVVEHLVGLGHRRIAHVTGDPRHADARARLAGYQDALRGAGLQPDARLVAEGTFVGDAGYRGVEALLQAGAEFTALFVANDSMAPSALLALGRHGIDVPRQVSVVGFDDDQQSAWLTPPLTTMRQRLFELGAEAATGLLRVLHGERPEVRRIEPELVIRESTAPVNRALPV